MRLHNPGPLEGEKQREGHSHFFSFPFIQRVCLLIKISTDAILSLTTNLPTGYVQLLIDLLLLPSV